MTNCLDGAVVSPIDRLAKQAEIYTSFMNQVQEEPKVEKEQDKSSENNRRVLNYIISFIFYREEVEQMMMTNC